MLQKRKTYYALFFPTIISLLVLMVYGMGVGMAWNMHYGGVFPQDVSTLWHVFSMPFVHADMAHLVQNVFSFWVLGSCLYYFYSDIANKMLLLSVIMSGLLLWCIGREAWHIGLSGMVYALVYFLFFSGVWRRFAPLIAISLVVVFLYGNNVWYMLPWQPTADVSWEGHLSGALTGTVLSVVFRKKGPQKPIKIWEEEEESDTPYWLDEIDDAEQM